MIIYDVLKKYENQKVRMYVDMDGVVADYDVGIAADYDKKRPLISNISKLKDVSEMPNVELHILSVTRMSNGIQEKNDWLDQFAPFFKKENRNILSREEANFEKNALELKYEFISTLKRDDSQIIFIDDDPAILRKIDEDFDDIVLLKDTTLVD